MKIEIRCDHVLVEGYVNVTARDSDPITAPVLLEGKPFVEQIMPGAFGESLRQDRAVGLMVNHAETIGSTETNLTLTEDRIGLYAVATVTCPEVRAKAKNNLLRGWSFGMKVIRSRLEERKKELPRRIVEALELLEVSIVDERARPAYSGTSIETRTLEQRVLPAKPCGKNCHENQDVCYKDFEEKINRLKGARQ